jgi:hypothetical protein
MYSGVPRCDRVFSSGEEKCLAKPKSQILITGGLLSSRSVLSSFRSLQDEGEDDEFTVREPGGKLIGLCRTKVMMKSTVMEPGGHY